MELTEKQQLEILEKYKEELICPICQKELVHKDYEINKKTLIYFSVILLMGLITGFIIQWILF